MKKYINFLFYGVMALLLMSKVPGIYKNFSAENKPAPVVTLKSLSGEDISFPIPNQKMIVVFWATWCGPCKVEMNRLNQMMADGLIKPNQVLAVSLQESAETVNAFLEKNPYQFSIALDESGLVSEKYNIQGTPTLMFVDENGNINWITTGLSPALQFRIKAFLD